MNRGVIGLNIQRVVGHLLTRCRIGPRRCKRGGTYLSGRLQKCLMLIIEIAGRINLIEHLLFAGIPQIHRCECIEHKVAVARSAPPPVHMIHAATAAIDDKSMTRILVGIHASVQDGTAGSKLFFNHGCPLVGSVVVTVEQRCSLIVAKSLHALQFIVAVSATATGAIAHVTGLPAIAHEHRHRILLLGSGIGGINVKHIFPIKCTAGQSAHGHTVHLGCVTIQSRGLCGILPVVHHLCHRRGHASCQAMLRANGRALVVERRTLVPCARDERRYHH